jgi:predicted  nucleic acid-binding Zn ribbon protein
MTYLERLQLKEAPPVEEVCRCSGRTPLHLRYAFSEFPLFCTDCTGQVFPSALDLSEDLAQGLVSWRTVYAALYDLWLDSSDYEAFASAALRDPNGDVNRRGLALALRLSEQRTTYYWWFRDDEDSAAEHCPVCRGPMTEHSTRRFRFCHSCRVSC